ncbi:MAG: NUDIX domain-containing protein [Candidatus Pacebacteria bacterium]|nr:NUDIX domain-containing protein [Candidatus Paceibacterota bacterium]
MCHDGNGRYLLNKRSVNCRDEHGRWDIGGGGIEFGDTIEDTLKKELEEEFGCSVLEFSTLGTREIHREHEGKKTHWVSFDHKVLINPEEVENREPHKFDDLGWFKLDEFPEPMHSQWPIFFEKYKDSL